jgi:hypothetical protein
VQLPSHLCRAVLWILFTSITIYLFSSIQHNSFVLSGQIFRRKFLSFQHITSLLSRKHGKSTIHNYTHLLHISELDAVAQFRRSKKLTTCQSEHAAASIRQTKLYAPRHIISQLSLFIIAFVAISSTKSLRLR